MTVPFYLDPTIFQYYTNLLVLVQVSCFRCKTIILPHLLPSPIFSTFVRNTNYVILQSTVRLNLETWKRPSSPTKTTSQAWSTWETTTPTRWPLQPSPEIDPLQNSERDGQQLLARQGPPARRRGYPRCLWRRDNTINQGNKIYPLQTPRSGFSNLLNSYKSRIDEGVEDKCPLLCSESAHAISHHPFSGPSNAPPSRRQNGPFPKINEQADTHQAADWPEKLQQQQRNVTVFQLNFIRTTNYWKSQEKNFLG